MPAHRDYRSAEATLYRRWYKTARWQAIRSQQLAKEPLCLMCEQLDRTTPATICDHVTPHRGDQQAFWTGPFQSLCAPCHDTAKQREERRGYRVGCDDDGRPMDPAHPWNSRRSA